MIVENLLNSFLTAHSTGTKNSKENYWEIIKGDFKQFICMMVIKRFADIFDCLRIAKGFVGVV